MSRFLPAAFLLLPLLNAQTPVIVEGTVVNRVTHQGISGVSVTLDRGTAGLAYRVATDSNGAFKFPPVEPGDYLPIYEKRGLSVVDAPVRPVHIDETSTSLRLHAEMIPWTRVSGRVLDTDGHAIPRVRVSLIPLRVGRNSSGTVAATDDTGSFTLAMQPGMYRLQADPYKTDDLRRGEATTPQPAAAAVSPRAWAPTYYPATTDPQAAQPITVISGTDLSGFDVRLQSVPLFHIRGTVLDTRGGALAGVAVKLVPPPANWWEPEETEVISSARGVFDIPAVRPGDWRVTAEVEHGESSLMGYAATQVTGADVAGVSIRLAEPFTVTGKVEGAAGHDSGDLCESAGVSLISTDISHEASGEVAENGTLHIPEVYPGHYKVQVCGVSSGSYLASVMLGDRDVVGREFALAPGAPQLRVIFKSDGGSVRGTVDQGEGRAVALVPADDALLDPMFVSTTTAAEGGKFQFVNLRPGEYHAFAFDHLGDVDALTDTAFLKSIASWATTVKVAHGQIVSVDLKAVHWPE